MEFQDLNPLYCLPKIAKVPSKSFTHPYKEKFRLWRLAVFKLFVTKSVFLEQRCCEDDSCTRWAQTVSPNYTDPPTPAICMPCTIGVHHKADTVEREVAQNVRYVVQDEAHAPRADHTKGRTIQPKDHCMVLRGVSHLGCHLAKPCPACWHHSRFSLRRFPAKLGEVLLHEGRNTFPSPGVALLPWGGRRNVNWYGNLPQLMWETPQLMLTKTIHPNLIVSALV